MAEPSESGIRGGGPWFSKLHWQVVIALAAGAMFGRLAPGAALGIGFIGDLFLRLLKMIIIPLIFTSLVSGIASLGNARSVGRIGIRTLTYYMMTTTLAITVGLTLVNLFQPGRGLDLGVSAELPEGFSTATQSLPEFLLRMVPDNIVAAMAAGEVLPVIVFAILFGLFMTRLNGPNVDAVNRVVEGVLEVIQTLTLAIVRLAPVGIFALLAREVARSGFDVIIALGPYFVTVGAGLAVHALVTLPLILIVFARRNPLHYGRKVLPAVATAFSTASSSATLPLSMECAEREAGIPKGISSFVLPLGATVNMDGTALYEAVAALTIAQMYGVSAESFPARSGFADGVVGFGRGSGHSDGRPGDAGGCAAGGRAAAGGHRDHRSGGQDSRHDANRDQRVERSGRHGGHQSIRRELRMKRLVLTLMCVVVVAPNVRAQSLSQNLRQQVRIQREVLRNDLQDLQDERAKLQEAWDRVERGIADMLAAEDQGESLESLELRDEDLRIAESELMMQLFVVQRLRGKFLEGESLIAVTESEIRRLEREVGPGVDPLSGTWRVVMEPGGQEGLMFLQLNGTLVQGTYRLSGNWSGSLRGSLVSGKVRLERVDSQLGFVATLYGKLVGAGDSATLEGSWEATQLAVGMPSGGAWLAERVDDELEE